MRGYDTFCPIAKASEVLATRWTPLILRELMADIRSFNDLKRGIPLISRAVLTERLRELEHHGIVERRRREAGGPEYWLTPAGEALRPVVAAFARWGLAHSRGTLKPSDLDPTYLVWGLRKRAVLAALPDRRVTLRFEFAGVPANRAKFRVLWLILERGGADVCLKDPGFEVDLVFKSRIADFVQVYLGHVPWREAAGRTITIEGDRALAKQAPSWLRLDKVLGRDLPFVRGAA